MSGLFITHTYITLFEYGKCIAPVVSNDGAEIAVGNALQQDHNSVLRYNLSIRPAGHFVTEHAGDFTYSTVISFNTATRSYLSFTVDNML